LELWIGEKGKINNSGLKENQDENQEKATTYTRLGCTRLCLSCDMKARLMSETHHKKKRKKPTSASNHVSRTK
jgi:hypothetical protein